MQTYVVSGFSRTVTVRLKADTTYEIHHGGLFSSGSRYGHTVSAMRCAPAAFG
jgi:hypothetical protein